MIRVITFIIFLLSWPVHAEDLYDSLPGEVYPSVETWDNEGKYDVITPNGVGGFESFDSRGVYKVIETPESMGAEPLRFPERLEDQFKLPHEKRY